MTFIRDEHLCLNGDVCDVLFPGKSFCNETWDVVDEASKDII